MKYLFLFLIFSLSPGVAHASFTAEMAQGTDGGRVVLFLSATTTSVNAVEGTLMLSPGARVEHIYTGSSLIQTWLEVPNQTGDRIRFAGIIPGGFVGSAQAGKGLTGPAELFSFELSGPHNALELTDGALYLNNGVGTRIALPPLSVPITLVSGSALQEEDRVSPEYVSALPVHDTTLFDGRPTLALSSFDAGSGIARFQIQEGNGAWIETEEAFYVLTDRSGLRAISVRAYDRAGNFIETRLPGRNAGMLWIGGIVGILLLLGMGALVKVYLYQRHTRA